MLAERGNQERTPLRVGFQLKFQHQIGTPTQIKMCSQQGKKKVMNFQCGKVLQLTNAYFLCRSFDMLMDDGTSSPPPLLLEQGTSTPPRKRAIVKKITLKKKKT
jgi:hypothetical protein